MSTKQENLEPRIGYLVSQYPAVNHTFILREVRALRRLRFDVKVVSIRPPDRPLSALSEDEASEHRQTFSVLGAGRVHALAVHARVFLRRPLAYLRTLCFAWSLTRGSLTLLLPYTFYFLESVVAGEYFERQDVRLVHSHFSTTVLLIMSRLFPIRYSMTVHGPDEFGDVVGFHMARKVSGAALVATISHYASSQVMKASDPDHWHKVHAIALGVDPAEFSPRVREQRSALDPFKLLFVGRLAPAKAQHLLIRTVAALVQRGRSVRLTLVGAGPSEESLQTLVSELTLQGCVQLVGACNHDRIVECYSDCDAFVLGSFAEGVPVVLMEAMAMEVPCVATWITGIPELIDNGVDGLLVPPASVQALVTAVERLMDDPQLSRQIALAGRRKVQAKYDLEKNAGRLGTAFRGLLEC